MKGWWFSESDADHFEDWVRHPLPHLVVIHDLESNVSYWVHVTADVIQRTGKGCKVLVPIEQTVDFDHLQSLLAVAASARHSESIEGSAFVAASAAISPLRRLRYALIAPRLVAPHRNVGYDRVLEPEEAVALIALGRFEDLRRFAEQHAFVPDPSSADTHRDWRWRLVHAFWRWAVADDGSRFALLIDDAPDWASRTAATILAITAARSSELVTEALALADTLVDVDKLAPIDLAWILAHRARTRADIGRNQDAAADCIEVLRHIVGDQDDPTVSALRTSAEWTLFRTTDDGIGRMGVALTAADTAVSWWRGQLVAMALADAVDRDYRVWADDSAIHWRSEDVARINLFAAELNADIAADQASWRAHCSLRNRELLMTSADEAELIDGLDGLRRSGDWQSLKQAARYIRKAGPVSALRSAVERIHDESWTQTTFKANLALLAAGGDLLLPQAATAAALNCVVLVKGAEIEETLRPTFVVALDACEALATLLSAATDVAHDAAAGLLCDPAISTRDNLQGPLSRVTRVLNFLHLSDQQAEQLRTIALSSTHELAAALLGILANRGDEEAGVVLRRRAADGDTLALIALGDVRAFSDEEAGRVIVRLTGDVRRVIDAANRGEYTVGNLEPVRALTLFNLWFPDLANWEVVVDR